MARRPLSQDSVGPGTAAIYRDLCDGAWHSKIDLIAVGTAEILALEPDHALANGQRIRHRGLASQRVVITEDDLRRSGAADSARNRLDICVRSKRVVIDSDTGLYRMTDEAREQWNTPRPAAAPATPPAPKARRATRAKTAPAKTGPADAVQAADVEVLDLDNPLPSHTGEPAYRAAHTTRHPARSARTRSFTTDNEADGWAFAPLHSYEMVHFKSADDYDVTEMAADLPDWARVEFDESRGLCRVWGRRNSADGDILANLINDFFAARSLRAKGLKIERDRRRRDLADLPDTFLSALCRDYGELAMSRIQKKMSTVRMFIPEDDDIQQHVYEWVLKAITTYDATKGVPFGAYLTQRVQSWVYDLPRARAGRSAADAEMNNQRAVSRFQQTYHRAPTDQELADFTGQDIEKVRHNAATIQSLNNVRNAQSFDAADGSPHIQVSDGTDASNSVLDEVQQTLISAAVTAACAPERVVDDSDGQLSLDDLAGAGTDSPTGPPNIIGWLGVYFTTWGGMTKTDLSASLGTSPRNLSLHQARAQENMKTSLASVATELVDAAVDLDAMEHATAR